MSTEPAELSAESKVIDRISELEREIESLKGDLEIVTAARDRFEKSFEAQQRMHEANVARVKELSEGHRQDHEAISRYEKQVKELTGKLAKLEAQQNDKPAKPDGL